ncbi:MAG: enoyl-CoA hydratase-related protein [Elusimicrobiota bacterium]|nr:enoyl-CoA hydratase-related protein [Elusimicrobiota bacterium]
MSAWTVRDEGKVRLLLLERAPGNTLVTADLRALAAAARAPGEARALVLGSTLPRYFSSGLDLAPILAATEDRRHETFEALLDAYRALLECPRPVVGALSGVAMLGGWILAMGCDWRLLAADTGKLALSEVRLGLTPTPVLIARLAGLSKDPRLVKEMVLRGASVRAQEALDAGLVDELAPEAEVLPRSVELARKLAKSAPAAYAAVKRGLNAPFLDAALWRDSLAEFKAVVASAEGLEGLRAMGEKRRPRWDD